MIVSAGLMPGRRAGSFLSIALLVSVIVAPLVFSLAARVPNIVEAPLFPDEPRNLLHFDVEASYDGDHTSRGIHDGSVKLYLADPSALLRYDQIRVLMRTFDTSPPLVEGRLYIQGTGCFYGTPPGAALIDREVLPLVRAPGCVPLNGQPNGELELTVKFSGPGRVGVLSRLPPRPMSDPGTIYVSKKQAHVIYRPALLGTHAVTLGRKGPRRVDLLNYVWQLTPHSWWIWLTPGIMGLLVTGGIWAFPWTTTRPAPFAAGARAFCFAAAIALGYVVLVPPFQAPDEPDHLLTYAQVAQRPELTIAAADWARLTHFLRIRFHPLEKFRESNIGQPFPDAWEANDVFADDVSVRSITTFRLWTTMASVLKHAGVHRTLLALRLTNAMMFALSVGLSCALLSWCTEAPGAHLAWFAVLFVPAVPFFAMHVSEVAVLTSVYVILSTGALAVFLGGRRSEYAGAVLGIGGAVLMTSGRSAIPFAAFLAAVLIGRVAVGEDGSPNDAAHLRRAVIFWLGILAGGPTFWLLSTPEYQHQLATIVTRNFPFLVRWFESRGTIPWLAAAVGAAGFVGEIASAWARARIRVPLGGAAALVGRGAALTVIGLMIGTIAQQQLPHATLVSPVRWDYVKDVLWTTGTAFRLHDPDILLSSTFWIGFGWLETMPPAALVVTLTTMTGLALAALLWRMGEARDVRRVVLAGIYLTGWCAALVLYAMSAHSMSYVLVGRYLIGLYLSMLAIAWSGLLLAPMGPARHEWQPRALPAALPSAVLLTLCGALHAYCLSFILNRYF